MTDDYYKILGLEKEASEKEIKKAFRAKALEFHPDRNPNDPQAEEKFKKISKAYEILSDPEKRQIYDAGGDPLNNSGFNPFGSSGFEGMGGGFEEFISQFFHGRRTQHAYQQTIRSGSDLQTKLFLTLEEVLTGCSKTETIVRNLRCKTCEGTKAEKTNSAFQNCSQCNGSGRVVKTLGLMQTITTCGQCFGAGKKLVKPCKQCSGKGYKQLTEKIVIKVPAGVHHGNTLRIAQKGNESLNKHGSTGNLFVQLFVKKHPIFERDGDELYTELKIPYSIAVLGGKIKVPILGTSTGQNPVLNMDIPTEGISEKFVLELPDKGIPNLKTGKRGMQIVKLDVYIPKAKNLSKEYKQLIQSLNKYES